MTLDQFRPTKQAGRLCPRRFVKRSAGVERWLSGLDPSWIMEPSDIAGVQLVMNWANVRSAKFSVPIPNM